MTVKALYDYTYPSADRAELFGDDQLVYVHWEGNLFLVSAAAFRTPKAITFDDFVTTMVAAWASSDPDFDPAKMGNWRLFDEPLPDNAGAKSLADLGIGHKALLKFSA